ncbi:MAG: UPF0175 family protein [Trichodesmium sp. MO_231.B1]|nr:UPF0175 family protein [Trichodesmium sp. MO_231.B1]
MRIPPDERLSRVRPELAVRLYQKGLLSFGKARELVNVGGVEVSKPKIFQLPLLLLLK